MSFNFIAANPDTIQENISPSGMKYISYEDTFDLSENKLIRLFLMEKYPEKWKTVDGYFNGESTMSVDLYSLLENAQIFINSILDNEYQKKDSIENSIHDCSVITDNRLTWFVQKMNEMSIHATQKDWKEILIYGY